MKVDIILSLHSGSIEDQFVVENETVAEAVFDNLCEELLEEDWEEFKEVLDYGYKLMKVNQYLSGIGREIVWLEQVKVNHNIN